jgi:hypothetical protein
LCVFGGERDVSVSIIHGYVLVGKRES